MKKALISIFTIFVLFIGFTAYTHESCGCIKPSGEVRRDLINLRDTIKRTDTDFLNVCTSTSTRSVFDNLNSEYQVQPICNAEKDNFTLQVRLQNHEAYCIDVDSEKYGYFLNKNAVTCD
jgi:hypothetical protein